MKEETLIIETPEHVELHFALATMGNRFLACAIDHLLQILTLSLFYLLATNLSDGVKSLSKYVSAGFSSGSLWIMAVAILISFVIFFGYFVIFETLWSGQTPGKRWMKLRVIREDGRPVDVFAALTRNLLRLADMIPPPFYSLGIVTIFANERSKRIGDFVAGTVVVKERMSEAPSFAQVFEGEIVDMALRRVAEPVNFRGDVRLARPEEIMAVEAFLRRRYELPEHPRGWLAWRIAIPLMEKIRPWYDPEHFSYEGFLEELLARYRGTVKARE
ncbi:MAG: RDD family protein [Blastocatellia bacterium]